MTRLRSLEHISSDAEVSSLLRRAVVAARVAPAAAGGVAWNDRGTWRCRAGAAGTRSWLLLDRVDIETPFDLASITKSLVAFAFARASERGDVAFSDRLSDLLPWAAETAAGARTCEALLSHRAGLRAHVELFAPLREGAPFDRARALEQAANATRPAEVDPTAPLYSDLGYILLGEALEAALGLPLDGWLHQQLTLLGIDRIGSARQLPHLERRAAATETVAYRGGEIVGAVHDDNAWALGGTACSGHAGLFGDVGALLRFGTLLLDVYHGSAAHALQPRTLRRLVDPRPGGSLRAGFDGKTAEASSIGTRLGGATFGHLGFTGTSLWCDPESRVVVCLLTNRVCPTRDNPTIREVRPRVHDALAELAV